MPGRAVELQSGRWAVPERLRDAKRVDPERVKPVERRVAEIAARQLLECLCTGVGQPRNLDEPDVVEIAQTFARLPVVDLAAGVRGNLADIGLHQCDIAGIERQK